MAEIANFLIAGTIAWFAWQRGMSELFGPRGWRQTAKNRLFRRASGKFRELSSPGAF